MLRLNVQLFVLMEAVFLAIVEFGIWDHDRLSIVMGVIVIAVTLLLRKDILLLPERRRRR